MTTAFLLIHLKFQRAFSAINMFTSGFITFPMDMKGNLGHQLVNMQMQNW